MDNCYNFSSVGHLERQRKYLDKLYDKNLNESLKGNINTRRYVINHKALDRKYEDLTNRINAKKFYSDERNFIRKLSKLSPNRDSESVARSLARGNYVNRSLGNKAPHSIDSIADSFK